MVEIDDVAAGGAVMDRKDLARKRLALGFISQNGDHSIMHASSRNFDSLTHCQPWLGLDDILCYSMTARGGHQLGIIRGR